MNKRHILIISSIVVAATTVAILFFKVLNNKNQLAIIETRSEYAGSRTCRECHERFYELWSPSHHGKAMQPIEDVLQNEELSPQKEAIGVGEKWYQVSIKNQKLFMHKREKLDAEEALKTYEAIYS